MPRPVDVDDDPLAMRVAVLPVVGRMFGTEDEHDLVRGRAERGDAAISPVANAINFTHLARLDVDDFDRLAGKLLARRIGPRIVNDPAAVRRPDVRVRENVPSWPIGNLHFVNG